MRRIDRRDFLMGLGWIATTDYLLCQNAILINQVNPKDQSTGVKINAEYVITAEWPVDIDADVDLHVLVPDDRDGTDVYYNAREFRGVTLDRDCKGFSDTHHLLQDGGMTVDVAAKEMTTLHGIVPGHYDVGVHMFKFHKDGVDVAFGYSGCNTPVHVEVIQLNPKTKLVFSKDVTLQRMRQCINVVSFELNKSGEITFVPVPLKPVTDAVFQ